MLIAILNEVAMRHVVVQDVERHVGLMCAMDKKGTYGQGYLGFAKMNLELLELLLELLLQLLLELLLELLLLLLLFSLPRTW